MIKLSAPQLESRTAQGFRSPVRISDRSKTYSSRSMAKKAPHRKKTSKLRLLKTYKASFIKPTYQEEFRVFYKESEQGSALLLTQL